MTMPVVMNTDRVNLYSAKHIGPHSTFEDVNKMSPAMRLTIANIILIFGRGNISSLQDQSPR